MRTSLSARHNNNVRAAVRSSARHDHGMSVMETLVMVAVIGLVAALALPWVARAMGAARIQSEQALAAPNKASEEAAFRALVRSVRLKVNGQAEQQTVSGDASVLTVFVEGGENLSCGKSGGPLSLQLLQDDDGARLLCQPEAVTIAAWPSAQAQFSYSRDGAGWTDRTDQVFPTQGATFERVDRSDDRPAPGLRTDQTGFLVKVDVRAGEGPKLSWIAHIEDDPNVPENAPPPAQDLR
jgi:Tfp pilus assembly major pilin PilA